MSKPNLYYYFVPDGTLLCFIIGFYKHIVPTELSRQGQNVYRNKISKFIYVPSGTKWNFH